MRPYAGYQWELRFSESNHNLAQQLLTLILLSQKLRHTIQIQEHSAILSSKLVNYTSKNRMTLL
jgi:hypothetical protein